MNKEQEKKQQREDLGNQDLVQDQLSGARQQSGGSDKRGLLVVRSSRSEKQDRGLDGGAEKRASSFGPTPRSIQGPFFRPLDAKFAKHAFPELTFAKNSAGNTCLQ
eukprot:GSA25T00022895001.1